MSEIHQTMRPNPSDYGIDGGGPKINQALADLVEMGLVVDSGQISERHSGAPKAPSLGTLRGLLVGTRLSNYLLTWPDGTVLPQSSMEV